MRRPILVYIGIFMPYHIMPVRFVDGSGSGQNLL